jgi:hypothetical protein
MWHDFVMYSEGCGGDDPKPLREAQVAIAHVADFFQACHPPIADETSNKAENEPGSGPQPEPEPEPEPELELEYEEAEPPRS